MRSLKTVIDILGRLQEARPSLPATTALELIIWENVAYLADDDRRLRAFRLLQETVGTSPDALLSATDDALYAVAKHGIVPDQTVGKLRAIGRIMAVDFPDGLDETLKLPVKQAIRALRKFPAIGEPAAEKILLFTRSQPIFALESNGLRVLQRLGYGADTGRYSADYRAVQKAALPEIPTMDSLPLREGVGVGADCDWLIRAHHLLRYHGQRICRRAVPECGRCPLAEMCDYAARSQLA